MRLIYLLLRMLLIGPLYGFIVALAVLVARHGFRTSTPPVVGNLHYGANYIDAKHLVIWYFVRTNNDLEEARLNGLEQTLGAKTRGLLALYGYPKSVISEVHVGIESRENIEKGGGDWQYFH